MTEHSAAAPYVRSDGLPLTPELLDEFLDSLRRKGRTPETLLTYRRNLNLLYDSLSEEKAIHPGTLEAWRRELLAVGYAPRTINLCISAARPCFPPAYAWSEGLRHPCALHPA